MAVTDCAPTGPWAAWASYWASLAAHRTHGGPSRAESIWGPHLPDGPREDAFTGPHGWHSVTPCLPI
jgi:hypothetical protein